MSDERESWVVTVVDMILMFLLLVFVCGPCVIKSWKEALK